VKKATEGAGAPAAASSAQKFPVTIGGCLAELARVRKLRAAAEAKVAPLAEQEAALRDHIMNTFAKDDIGGARGSGLSLSLVTTKSPKVGDWDAFWGFAKRKGNEDLLNRAVNSAAWRERAEAGVSVPGIEVFTNVALRVTSLKGSDK
jgi:hypothetical protein